MRKILIPLLLFVALVSIVFSCKKEPFTEEDALNHELELNHFNDSLDNIRDSLNHYGGVIQYTVNVVSAGDASFNKSITGVGVDSVSVTISQYGYVNTKSVTNGQVTFADLRIGTAAVSIHSTKYTNVDLVVDLTPYPVPADPTIENWYNQVRLATTQVPVFPLTGETMATIKGRATYETNLVNNEPEIAAGVQVLGVIDVDDPSFSANFLNTTPGGYAGMIVKLAYSSTVSRTITDENGDYTLQVPSAADGLAIKVLISDIVKDQTLLLHSKWGQNVYGEQSVRTIFSSEIDNVTKSPTSIPRVAAAYVSFSSPTGTANLLPSTQATATAVISESGIETILINNTGSGYTQAPLAVVTGGFGQGALITPVLNNGLVSSFTINNAGSGYTNSNPPVITLLHHGDPGAGIQATATARLGYSVSDYIVTNGGSGYTSIPSVTVTSGAGSGATAQALMNGYISSLSLTSSGSGYTTAPTILFGNNNGGINATATATMTNQNPIREILVNSNTNTYFDKANPPTTLSISGAGSGATASFTMSNAGKVSYAVTMTNIGAGYDPIYPPAVIITGDGFGATADATVNGGGSITVNILTQGQNYTTASISIGAPPSGGTQATATATILVTVAGISVTNNGNGYVNGSTTVQLDGITFNDVSIFYNMSVQSIALTNAGQDFTGIPNISFASTDGQGTGASATASVKYSVSDILVITEGSDYEFTTPHPVVVTIAAPPSGGSQAFASAVAGNGKVKEVMLTNGGTGYTAAPHVYLSGAGFTSEAIITASVGGGSVTGFTVVSSGSGYTSTPMLSIRTYDVMASATGTAHPQAGQVVAVNIINAGEGYTVAPNVEFEIINGNGSGFGAAATATLDGSGRVNSVSITNSGSGYYVAPQVRFVVPNYNLTAAGVANVSPDGHISSVTLVDANGTPVGSSGQGYISIPTITFTASVTGMGMNATGIAEITNGAVTGVIMTNQGSGYLGQNAHVTFGSGADQVGKPITIYSATGNVGTNNGFTVEAGKTYIIDMDLGTGIRTVED